MLKRPIDLHADLHVPLETGARSWTRTNDPLINSQGNDVAGSGGSGVLIYTKTPVLPRYDAGSHGCFTQIGGCMNNVDVLAVMGRACTALNDEGLHTIGDDLCKVRRAIAGLIEAATQAKRAYWLARNSAAGLTNYCDESASSRRCERELSEAESIWHSAGLDAALANIGQA